MIIGAQKAGTTALKNYLGEHPEIITHERPEFAFFKDDKEYSEGFNKKFEFYFNVETSDNKKIVAKNVVICDSEIALKRLKEHNPDCRLVFIIREPISRAYSSYQMEYFRGWMKNDFNEIVGSINSGDKNNQLYRLFVKLGLYSEQIELIHKYFPPNQLKIFLYEDLAKNTDQICKNIFEWLRLTDTEFKPDFSKKHNETAAPKFVFINQLILKIKRKDSFFRKLLKHLVPNKILFSMSKLIDGINKSDKKLPPMDQSTEKFLKEFYKPYNIELQKLTGLDLSLWEENYKKN